MELQKFGHDQSPYERPNEKWVCGWAASGDPCPHGPDAGGKCNVVERCTPVREAGGFRCGLAPINGGPCKQGPLPDGSCCCPAPRWPRCQPRLSLGARRRRATWLVCLAAVALLAVLLGGPARHRFLSPGPMTSAHAVLAGNSCNVCHGDQPQSLEGFITAGFAGVPHATLSTNCAACHFSPDDKAAALLARSVAPETLAHGGSPASSPPAGHLSCATCHREHRGRDAAMASLSDSQCQACHQQRFDSFSHGHPAFRLSPAAAAPRTIAFDHDKHKDRFTTSGGWDCTRCHDRAKPTALLPFAQSCGSCHFQSETDHHLQKIQSGSQLLFQAPELKVKDAAAGEWSDDIGRGDDIPLLTRLLMLGDDDAVKGIADARGWDPLDWSDSDSVMPLAIGLKKAMREMLAGDVDALARRLAIALGLPPTDPAVKNLAAALKVDAIGYTAAQKTALDKFLAFKDAPSVSLPAAKPAPPMSRWAFTDRYTLRYERPDHADPLATRLLEAVAAAAASPKLAENKYRADLVAAILKGQGTLSPLTNNCLRCHVAQPGRMAWSGGVADGTPLKAIADPHQRLRAQAVQCIHCHESAPRTAPPAAAATAAIPRDHAGLSQERCASCHRTAKVREDCLTCHVYHLTRPMTANLMPPAPKPPIDAAPATP